jgi:hypothetical protein
MAPPFITVSGTVIDPNSIPYAGGTIIPVLNVSGSPLLPDGSPYVPPLGPFGLDTQGKFSFNLVANNQITPAGSSWSFIIASARGTVPIAFGKQSVTFVVPSLTLLSSQDISSQIAALALALTYGAGGGETGPPGPQGPPGEAATVAVGTTSTGQPGSNASVTNSGTSSAAVLNFTVPAGATGATGPTGPQGAAGPSNTLAFDGTNTTIVAPAPSAAGQVLVWNGTNWVVGAAPLSTVLARGSGNIPAQTFPANSATTASFATLSPAVATNAILIVNATSTGLANTAGWSTGNLIIQGPATVTNGITLAVTVCNPSSTAIAAGALPVQYVVMS